MKDNALRMPDYCVFEDDNEKWGRSSPLSQWMQGVLTAHFKYGACMAKCVAIDA